MRDTTDDSAGSAVPDPVASVVIPSYNGGHVIGRCVASLLAQQTDFAYEVIVVDSSSDGTPEMLREQFPDVRLIHFDQQTAAPRQRNVGIENARGQIVGMMDQDCVADPGWLQGMVEAHRQRPDILMVAGGIRPANPERLWGLANFLMEFREFNHLRPSVETNHWITCNCTAKRELFARHGHFPEHIWPADDVILAHRMAQAGGRTLFIPELSIAHINRGEPSAILRHARVLGRASAIVRRLLPGRENAWMVARPAATYLLPLAMPLRTLYHLGRWKPGAALKALALLPLMSIIAAAWARGFREGIAETDLPAVDE